MPDDPGDLKPRPDPSILTTEQLHREIEHTTIHFNSRLAALQALLEEKLHAVTLIQSKSEASALKHIDQLSEMHDRASRDTDRRIIELLARIGALENRGAGMNQLWGYIAGATILIVMILTVTVSVVLR